MTTITLRQTGTDTADIDFKGAPLTNNEVDANFSNLLTQVQGKEAASANLSAIASLTPTNNNFIVGTGATFALESPTSARTSLGLGTIATQNSNNITITGGSINGAAIGASTASTGAFTNLSVSGNLTVNGTTTTVNSTTVTVDDPVITLGGDTNPTSDDNKDRGVEFRYHDGSSPRTGFMGWDDSTGKFTLLKVATNTSEVFSGTKAELDANVAYSNITGTPTIGNGAMTVTAGAGLTGGGQVGTANQTGASSVTVSHADTSSVSNLSSNNSGNTFIQDISFTFDTYGHVTAATVATATVNQTDFVIQDGDGTNVTINDGNYIKFIEGAGSGATIDINWTDTTPGSSGDPYDLTFAVTNTDKGSSQNIFKNIAVSGQSAVVADTNNDTLTLVAGTNVTITTDAATDSITINSAASDNIFKNIAVSGQSTVAADSNNDTLTFFAGASISITTNPATDSISIASTDTLATVTARGASTSTAATFSGGINMSNSNITNGGIITATEFNATSDMRLKDNITAVQNPLDILAAISGVQFNWKANGKEAVGVLAQEIEKVLPQIVNTNADGYKAVSYDSLIPILIEAIKELAAKVK